MFYVLGAAVSNYLTEDTLRKHDSLVSSSLDMNIQNGMDDISDCNTEVKSARGTFKSTNTFATDWSCCTNVTFSQ